LKKSKKKRSEASSSNSSSSSGSSEASEESVEIDSEVVSETTETTAGIPIRAHPGNQYHKVNHHSDNFHSNHVNLDALPEIQVEQRQEDSRSSRSSSKQDFVVGGFVAPVPRNFRPTYVDQIDVVLNDQPTYVDQVDVVLKERKQRRPEVIVKAKAKKMGKHSDLHHHHLEYFGAKLDSALHPRSHYPKSRKAYSLSEEIIIPESKPAPEAPASAAAATSSTFTIPCHHIRIGDLVILQQRPCQVIRITTSAATGQHRYLGVDLFTKELHEEPCVVTHPSPSVILHSMLTPGFKQYRLLDIREDGKLVAMTETGDVKAGLDVVDQGSLAAKVKSAFGYGTGAVRVLVISDTNKELVVDYKVVHLGQKL